MQVRIVIFVGSGELGMGLSALEQRMEQRIGQESNVANSRG